VPRQPGSDPGVPGHVAALLPCLRDAAPDDVVDEPGIDVVAVEELAQRVGEQVGRVPSGERALPLADRSAQRVDDDGFARLHEDIHGTAPGSWRTAPMLPGALNRLECPCASRRS
jgi:hypothetical protein